MNKNVKKKIDNKTKVFPASKTISHLLQIILKNKERESHEEQKKNDQHRTTN